MAKIVIHRKKAAGGAAQTHDVFLMNQYLGELKNGGTIEIPVDVGTHYLTFNSKTSFGKSTNFTCVVNYPNEVVEIQTKVSFSGDYVVEYADNAPHIPVANAATVNAEGVNQEPFNNSVPIVHPKKKKSKGLTVAIIFVIVLFCVGISALVSETVDDTAKPKTQKASNSAVTSSNTVTTVKVGQALNANGLKISFLKVEDWQSDNMFIKPEDGYKFIRAYFVIENKNKRDYIMGGYDFKCYADNAKMDYSIYGDNQIDYASTVSSGRKIEGYMYFEVPTNAKSIEIEYETNFWTDRKAIFKVK